ncbi:MAG: hypothetical protein M3Y57_10470 [Acidobacteriota bacterium]|nr:hypothetical protein [Acidobacteriota bacterium]
MQNDRHPAYDPQREALPPVLSIDPEEQGYEDSHQYGLDNVDEQRRHSYSQLKEAVFQLIGGIGQKFAISSLRLLL